MPSTELGTWESKLNEIFLIFMNSQVIQSSYCHSHILLMHLNMLMETFKTEIMKLKLSLGKECTIGADHLVASCLRIIYLSEHNIYPQNIWVHE